jgi:hypothetical protein
MTWAWPKELEFAGGNPERKAVEGMTAPSHGLEAERRDRKR